MAITNISQLTTIGGDDNWDRIRDRADLSEHVKDMCNKLLSKVGGNDINCLCRKAFDFSRVKVSIEKLDNKEILSIVCNRCGHISKFEIDVKDN
jgi:hypothetical protein